MDVAETRQALQATVREYRSLRQAINSAVRDDVLDDETLSRLKTKMEVLQENLRETCIEIDEWPQDLIDQRKARWWETENDSEQLSPSNQVLENPIEVFNDSATILATFSFLVPTVSLLSCIPAALAWTRASSAVGTVDDAEFYQLVSASAMQILSVATLIWPTVFQARLARSSRIWTWILACVSTCFAILAMLLYNRLPPSWSSLLSFGGSVAQALVTLQLVHLNSSPENKLGLVGHQSRS
ncbi:MAG: hypothetical protein M1825_004400 [Sarcosagium campestre]|nr:MAG: hypothetical protein M1825_004400 [Sarcosagium campestre]